MDPAGKDELGRRIGALARKARGHLMLLKSARDLAPDGARGPLYLASLKRFRQSCARLSGMAEASTLLLGEGEASSILSACGCAWDPVGRKAIL